jgi:PAS domain S-box-containing protein
MGRNRHSVTAPDRPTGSASGQSLSPQPRLAAGDAVSAQFMDFYNLAPVGFITLSEQGLILDANFATSSLLGVSRLILIGQPLTRYIVAQDQDRFYLFRKMVITTGLSQSVELRILCEASSPLWVELFATDAKDLQGASVQRVVITDISERKNMQQRLEQSEFSIRSLIDELQVGVMLQGPKAEVLLCNSMALNLLGLTQEQVQGQAAFDPDWNVIHENGEPFPSPTQPVPQAILTRRPVCNVVMGVYNSKTRDRNWLLVNAHPHLNADSSVQQVVCTFHDIKVRKLIESELKSANLAAQAASVAKSRFLAAASHDLRQPLAALSLFVSVLRNKSAPELQILVGNIQDCVDSLSELLTDLLDISKLEAGAVISRPANFAVFEFFAALELVFLGGANSKNLQFRIRRPNFVACTDQQLLRRIVGNFLANAIRYTSTGGLLMACRQRAGKQWIEVWDTGIGIPADKLDVIFEEFSQLGDAARTQGSGLGLAIASRMARLMGLQIRLRSRVGRGSVFAIELPPGFLAPSAAVYGQTSTAVRKFRIALLDDNARVLRALTMMLEGAGHHVVAAATLDELLERLRTGRPDILVSDYRLSDGQTGFEAIEAARSLLGADLPALIVTGDTDPSLIRSISSQGITVLCKPIRTDILQAAICAEIDRRPA